MEDVDHPSVVTVVFCGKNVNLLVMYSGQELDLSIFFLRTEVFANAQMNMQKYTSKNKRRLK